VVTVTIHGQNDAPLANDDQFNAAQDMSVSGNVLANDTDVDSTDTRAVVAVNGLAAAVGQPVATPHGTVTLHADGTFTDMPGLNCEATSDSFTYTICDGHGGVDTATVTISIASYTSVSVAAGVLRVGGGDGADVVTVAGGNLIVNGVAYSLAGVSEVRVWARGGNDTIDLTGLAINSFIHGGGGNDNLTGGSANDVIFGGLGDDTITGAAGHDFLIGGTGKDRIVGSAGNDILVSGEVSCSLDLDSLRAISAAWAAQASDAQSADDVLDEGVIGDESSDMLTGSSGADLFFISSNDKITDFKLDKSGASKDGDVVIVVD
jgi:Ca2+-binding RTX toxin-like protein